MSVQFCMIVNKSKKLILANTYEYDPGYAYSEYTRQDPSTDIKKVFVPFSKILGTEPDLDGGHTPILFENREKAQKYLENNLFIDEEDDYGILSFAEVDAVVEKLLLDK